MLSAALTQFVAGYGNSGGSTTSFYTFCIDLTHTVINDRTYAVTPRGDVTGAFVNGAEMVHIMDHFGSGDLTENLDQAAAVQIALWDLSLSNHTSMLFVSGGDGIYSSGEEAVFNVRFC